MRRVGSPAWYIESSMLGEETVFVGQTVMVNVEAGEQMAGQEPKILATYSDCGGH